jgi:hypothetical protein
VELTFYYALMLWRAFLKARRERREREEKVRVAYRPCPAKRGQYPESRGTVAPNPGIVRVRSKVGSAVTEAPTHQEGRNYLLRRARGKKGGR